MLNQCEQVSTLLDWLPPQPDESAKAQVSHMPAPGNGHAPLQPAVDAGDREFFATYYRLLQLEGRAGEQQKSQGHGLHISSLLRANPTPCFHPPEDPESSV